MTFSTDIAAPAATNDANLIIGSANEGSVSSGLGLVGASTPVPPAAAPTSAPALDEGGAETVATATAAAAASANEYPAPDPLLLYILQQPRGHNGKKELAFHSWLVSKIKGMGHKPTLLAEQCITLTVGKPSGTRVLFSCHIDTVHHAGEEHENGLMYDASMGHIALDTLPRPKSLPKQAPSPTAGSCLGADDGVGVWLMLKMIEAGVPGGYIFHRGEERGGIGSNAMLAKHKDWLDEWDAAVAFDRPRDYEVITHQGGQRCCSDVFGKALADAINAASGNMMSYELSPRGVFTDTKVYRGIIPECTNIGVGYYEQHSNQEYLDYGHLLGLRDVVLKLNWADLPVVRNPFVSDAPVYPCDSHFAEQLRIRDAFATGLQKQMASKTAAKKPAKAPPAPAPAPRVPLSRHSSASATPMLDEWLEMSLSEIEDYVAMDPGRASDDIVELAVEAASLRAQLNALRRFTLGYNSNEDSV